MKRWAEVLSYVIEPDGNIQCLDHQELGEYINEHQDMDFIVESVREDVVNWIQENTP